MLGAAGLLAAGGIYYYKTKGGGGGGSGSGSGPSDGNNGPRGGVGVSITAEQLKEFYEQCERALKIQKSRRST